VLECFDAAARLLEKTIEQLSDHTTKFAGLMAELQGAPAWRST
jgi:hypothetical protein